VTPGSLAAAWAGEDLGRLASSDLLRTLEPRESPQGAQVTIGRTRYVNFSSNDYLGLANDARLVEAASAELTRSGVGAGASRLLAGDTGAHRSLERTIAEHMGTEAALVFNSGYAANTGVLSALAPEAEDAIFSDALNHASIVDGCRLSRAKTVVYPHRDLAALERALVSAGSARRRVIVTESVFSMDGDRAPLRALAELAAEHRAALVLDEAHAIGVLGPSGRGLAAELSLLERVDVLVGTLGKALGSFGAFVAARRSVVELLVNRVRPFVFSTAIPPAICAASERAIRIIADSNVLQTKLHSAIERFRSGLSGRFPEAHAVNEHTPIFSIVLGSPERALAAGRAFRNRGLLAKPIRPPTVPDGTSRLRLSMSAAHSEEDLDRALAVLREIGSGRSAAAW
jgi:8-amino-7-oxononanoate synthase